MKHQLIGDIDLFARQPIFRVSAGGHSKLIKINDRSWQLLRFIEESVADNPEVVAHNWFSTGHNLLGAYFDQLIAFKPIEMIGTSSGKVFDEQQKLPCRISHIR